jgi:hypothetical protein
MQSFGTADSLVAHPSLAGILRGTAWALTILNFVLAFGLLVRRLRPYLCLVAFAYMFLAMLAFSHTYASSYEYLISMTILIACVPPAWIHELVGSQTPRRS